MGQVPDVLFLFKKLPDEARTTGFVDRNTQKFQVRDSFSRFNAGFQEVRTLRSCRRWPDPATRRTVNPEHAYNNQEVVDRLVVTVQNNNLKPRKFLS